jgi:hypothetical protein
MVAPRDPWVGVPIHRLKWQSGFVKTWQGASSAAKSDTAEAPYELWDARVWQAHHCHVKAVAFHEIYGHSILESLRHTFLRVWCRRVTQSLLKYLRDSYGGGVFDAEEAQRDIQVGCDC